MTGEYVRVSAQPGVLTADDASVLIDVVPGWRLAAVKVGPHRLACLLEPDRGAAPDPVIGRQT